MSEVFVGQSLEVEFTVTDQDGAVVDISGATALVARFCLPDKTSFDRTATLKTDGTDGKATYTTSTIDLSIAGEWKVQLLVTEGASFYPTTVVVLIVRELGC